MKMKTLSIVMALLAVAATAHAAARTTTLVRLVRLPPGTDGTPNWETEWHAGGANLVVRYGKPSLKGRAEAVAMPRGREWRTGANESTALTTNKALRFGTVTLPAGTYTLFTVPGDTSWQLIFSKSRPSATAAYAAGMDAARVPMTAARNAAPVEVFNIAVENAPPAGGILHIEWGLTRVSAAFTVVP